MNLDHVFKKTKTALKKSESTTTVPDGLLCRCSRCKKPILVQEVRDAYYICPKCGGYFKVRAYERIRRVADEGTFLESDRELVGENPLGFEGYEEKLATERLKTRMKAQPETFRFYSPRLALFFSPEIWYHGRRRCSAWRMCLTILTGAAI